MLNRRQQQLVRLGCGQSAIGTRLFAVGTRLWAIGRRHSPSCSCAPIASLRRKQKIALFMNACVCMYVCVRGCVCAPLPALFIHCFIKGPTCTTCMSMHVYLCVCKVCCPTNDAFVVVVVFACTNYFILHMYHKHSYVCVCVSLVTLWLWRAPQNIWDLRPLRSWPPRAYCHSSGNRWTINQSINQSSNTSVNHHWNLPQARNCSQRYMPNSFYYRLYSLCNRDHHRKDRELWLLWT